MVDSGYNKDCTIDASPANRRRLAQANRPRQSKKGVGNNRILVLARAKRLGLAAAAWCRSSALPISEAIVLSLPAARLAHPAKAALLAVSEHRVPRWMEQSVYSERITGGTGVVIPQAMDAAASPKVRWLQKIRRALAPNRPAGCA
ncbi:hypothetical protein TGAM01_v210406 [Trichoderma gamsii]|uniref:Uncharacterized protein n=1 Tax=Trichoderma gamsii TaxID=398673 RepID=A0A2P4Z8V8_9HYPO|nr:hypothetical protein TGAM01_v210406 [Trichoderma gamsii]PON20716.1 hypothetical protein TGAM01_v210406 [Trichoderma gamsii]